MKNKTMTLQIVQCPKDLVFFLKLMANKKDTSLRKYVIARLKKIVDAAYTEEQQDIILSAAEPWQKKTRDA